MRNPRLTVLGAVLAVFLSACLGNDAGANDPDINDPLPTTPMATIDWSDPTAVADLGGGWTMQACEGDGPFLCVHHDGDQVGTLEAISFPIASFSALDPTADDSANLAQFARGFHESLEADRTATCGDGYTFERLGPDDFVLGGLPGVSYGYVSTMADGMPAELNLQFATISGEQIILITAIAYDEGQCPGRDDQSTWDSSTLSEFRQRMEGVLSDSPLPNL